MNFFKPISQRKSTRCCDLCPNCNCNTDHNDCYLSSQSQPSESKQTTNDNQSMSNNNVNKSKTRIKIKQTCVKSDSKRLDGIKTALIKFKRANASYSKYFNVKESKNCVECDCGALLWTGKQLRHSTLKKHIDDQKLLHKTTKNEVKESKEAAMFSELG